MSIDLKSAVPVGVPVRLAIGPHGEMEGASGRYEKRWGELDGIYRDTAAFDAIVRERGRATVAYHVSEHRYSSQPGALIVGTSTVLPGVVGAEFAMTRGHLHGISDRAELYHCLSGHGVMLLDSVDGQSVAIELRPGQAVNVPGDWVHRSVNVGTEPFVTLFCYNADAGQDYGIIADAGGMKTLVVGSGSGWEQVPNPDHRGYASGRAR
ncbi:glucose-6-phosphate isomerase family protein [Microbacterium sp. PRC9]|uniref:glucose-6-phosphate isomerase family protein n=1 Tax=Microbacterium sp. PRC9 TaxID=2962591 RepID=UPI0028825FFC|nr:glucose-6-phosphate isomerase family protein [Microbacterium sp. PRC9]MDT0144522.1 glucose-6-phosphate isomerase family protein [Microbacterium sp. PRC9]